MAYKIFLNPAFTGLLKIFIVALMNIWPSFWVAAQRPGNTIERDPVSADTSQQVDLIDIGKRLLHIKPSKPRNTSKSGIYFSALPFSTQVPGGGTALITSTTAGFYLGDRAETYMSKVSFTPYWNFKQRFGLPIRSYVWLKNNNWVISGDTRMLVYPSYTWGLGKQYKQQDGLLVNYTYLRFYQKLLKRISKGFFTGIGYHLDYHMHIRTSPGRPALKEYTGYAYGTDGTNSLSSGVSMNLLFDTRTNSFNPWDGHYRALQFRINPSFMGNNRPWKSVYLDVRKYRRFSQIKRRQNMLAFWGYIWTVLDREVPYLDLPRLGWEDYNRSGRGFDQNRYRGRTLLHTEVEYRRDITDNGLLGFVLFTNANTVSGPRSIFLIEWNPAIGAGVRIKKNKRSATNIGLNYAQSLNTSHINLTLGEVF